MFWKIYNEDNIFGDITTENIIPKDLKIKAKIIAKEECILAGINHTRENLKKLGIESSGMEDGIFANKGDVVLILNGSAREILKAERTILNILGRMSGIATETRRIVEKVKKINPNIKVSCTRKTLWGYLDKKAVETGGGDTHRWNLGDMVLIKDNHIKLVGLEDSIKRAKKVSFTKKIEVEVENEEDAMRAAKMGVDIIMLDNMNADDVCRISNKLKKYNVLVEVSGNITPENIEEYAKCNVDIISMGYLTHSSRAINFSLEVEDLR